MPLDKTESDEALKRIIVRPNASLTNYQAVLLCSVIGLTSLLIGLYFASLGCWLVLPFSGLEVLLLAVCMHYTLQSCSVREVITITADKICIEKGRNSPENRYEFERYWAQINWVRSPINGHPSRLAICSHGKKVEVGRFLLESDRARLAIELMNVTRYA